MFIYDVKVFIYGIVILKNILLDEKIVMTNHAVCVKTLKGNW